MNEKNLKGEEYVQISVNVGKLDFKKWKKDWDCNKYCENNWISWIGNNADIKC